MLEIKPIENLVEALDMVEVRNSGRQYMTTNAMTISVPEQIDWYAHAYLPANEAGHAYAFVGYENKQAAAYGLVVLRDEDYWVTGVLAPQTRGRGRGEQLFRHLSEFVFDNGLSERVLLDVLKTNDRAIRLYQSLGFVALFDDEQKFVMTLNKEDYESQFANL